MAVAAGASPTDSTNKTRQVKFWASERLYTYYQERAKRRGVSMAEFVRDVLEAEMERHPVEERLKAEG